MDTGVNQPSMQQPPPSSAPEPAANQPVKKTSDKMLMVSILVGMLAIFVLLFYVLAMNRNVAQVQEQKSIVSPPAQPIENVAPSPVTIPTAEDDEIDNIDAAFEDLDKDLQGL